MMVYESLGGVIESALTPVFIFAGMCFVVGFLGAVAWTSSK